MNYIGSDFNSSGSVMAKAELKAARTKRGECVTCGRKCFRKKLFKMLPLDVEGKVLNGRCLNCKPLHLKDISMSSFKLKSNPHLDPKSPYPKFGASALGHNSSNHHHAERARLHRKNSSSKLQLQDSQPSNHRHHAQHNPHDNLRKCKSSQGVAERGREGEKPSQPGRTKSTPPPHIYDRNGSSSISNNFNINNANQHSSTHSNGTASTSLTTRPSFASSSLNAPRTSPSNSSTRSMGSSSSSAAAGAAPRPPLSTCNSNGSNRSLALGRFEKNASQPVEISWTPPTPLDFDDNAIVASDTIRSKHESENNLVVRPPSRLNSLKTIHSTSSKQPSPPTREELEHAALTLMAAQQHGFTGAGKLSDIFDELANSSRNLASEKKHEDEEHARNILATRGHGREQESGILESDGFVPHTISTSAVQENDEDLGSPKYNQPLLNRGGSFQPRYGQGHSRPGIGTNVYTTSNRTLSSMSSIGEEDHLSIHQSLQEPPQSTQPQPSRMGSFSKIRSSRTLGSLSTIEVINEEETEIDVQSSLGDISTGSFSVDRLSISTPAQDESLRSINDQDNHLDTGSTCTSLSLAKRRRVSLDSDSNSNTSKSNCGEEGSHPFQEHLKHLREFSDSPKQTQKVLELLSEMEPQNYVREDEEVGLCEMETVLTSIESHKDVREVQLWGCRALWNLSSSTAQAQHNLVRAGAADVITRAMKRFLKNGEDLQEWAIAALSNLAANPSNTNTLVGKSDDAVEGIIAVMGQYSGNAGVQTKGCEAITNLASHEDPLLRLKIMEKGAGEAILFNSMAMHAGNPAVQASALSAVRNLCAECEENQIKFLDLGVVDPMLSAMQKHQSSASVQEAGAGAISILSRSNYECKTVIEENGGIILILRAILHHSKTSLDCGQSSLMEWCCRALVDLALDFGYQINVSASFPSENIAKATELVEGIISTVSSVPEDKRVAKVQLAITAAVTAMDNNENIPVVQEIGCLILAGLAELFDEGVATNATQTKMDIVDEGALDAINMAMVLHKTEPRVQERACALLLSLAIEENHAAMQAAIGVQLLREAAKNYPDQCKDPVTEIIRLFGTEEASGD